MDSESGVERPASANGKGVSRSCVDCGGPISRTSAGRCRACAAARLNGDPNIAARRRAAHAAFLAKPETKAALAKRIAGHIANMSDSEREQRREHGRRIAATVLQSPEVRARSNSPEAKALAGRRRTDTVLAWCPEAYRDRYRYLKNTMRMRAAEARRLIEDEIAADERKQVAKMTLFERQIAKVAAGARVVAKPVIRRAEYDFTLGGVAAGML